MDSIFLLNFGYLE